jgi:hypothetical protein
MNNNRKNKRKITAESAWSPCAILYMLFMHLYYICYLWTYTVYSIYALILYILFMHLYCIFYLCTYTVYSIYALIRNYVETSIFFLPFFLVEKKNFCRQNFLPDISLSEGNKKSLFSWKKFHQFFFFHEKNSELQFWKLSPLITFEVLLKL